MFQISRRADYAVRIVLELGDRAGRERLPAARLAQLADVPLPFLHKISGELVKAGLVRSYSGPGGGLRLARAAADINMLQIIEAVEGPICLNVCLLRPRECPRDLICPAHDVWGRLQASLVRQLQEATLDQLLAERRDLKRHPRRRDIQYLYPEAL